MKAALRFFPPLIRESLLSTDAFRAKLGFETNVILSFVGSDISIRRSEFYDAIRRVSENNKLEIELTSTSGQKCIVKGEQFSGESLPILISEGRTILTVSSWSLSPDAAYRLKKFDEHVCSRNLHGPRIQELRAKLADGALADEDADRLNSELAENATDVEQFIANSLRSGSSEMPVLVPHSLAYYERLVGAPGDCADLMSFLAETCGEHLGQLLAWDFQRGLAQCLLSSPHSSISSKIKVGDQSSCAVRKFYAWLVDDGDRFSQVAGLEVGLAILHRFPEIADFLLGIATQIRDDDPADPGGRLSLTASLTILVDGELARSEILRSKPPFWRRLAAIAQASLIEREVLKLENVQYAEFCQTAMRSRGQEFYLQAMTDLRVEPRWLPDFMNPDQLKAEFAGRILATSTRVKENIVGEQLRRVLVEEGSDSIHAQVVFPFAYLPGPLEGGTVSPVKMPADLADVLRQQLEGRELTASSFTGIINSAMIFPIDAEHTQAATDALRKMKYNLDLDDEVASPSAFLAGLAGVAAVTRSSDLATDVRILLRVLSRRDGVCVDIQDKMRIALIASAANADLPAWCQSVGDWLTEIAYGDVDAGDARKLLLTLDALCGMVPYLWRSCAKARAALASVGGRLNLQGSGEIGA
ncbi:hypothetical protein [Limobrevibacterium gyesilva]|uniref:Uncharacterized protein n=1 Tax=Limobrevibacterium gyesilva TaxID=2991712 RepID=A0AA41YST9_9PROT|nr:hypothetical protein [Limobrevibacterium gyesilva]MCW3477688.1 hypothetical protein [Limobrevibacterium gyesilva]